MLSLKLLDLHFEVEHPLLVLGAPFLLLLDLRLLEQELPLLLFQLLLHLLQHVFLHFKLQIMIFFIFGLCGFPLL